MSSNTCDAGFSIPAQAQGPAFDFHPLIYLGYLGYVLVWVGCGCQPNSEFKLKAQIKDKYFYPNCIYQEFKSLGMQFMGPDPSAKPTIADPFLVFCFGCSGTVIISNL